MAISTFNTLYFALFPSELSDNLANTNQKVTLLILVIPTSVPGGKIKEDLDEVENDEAGEEDVEMGPEGGSDQKSKQENEVDGHGDEEQKIKQGAVKHDMDPIEN